MQHAIETSGNYAATHKRPTSQDRCRASLADFDTAPASAYVRLPVVCKLFSCSPATVWRRVQDGMIPAPKKFGPRHTAWNIGELRKALGL